MTYSDTEPRGTLKYRLLSNSYPSGDKDAPTDPGQWGHEYVRHLAAELGSEFALRTEPPPDETEPAKPPPPAPAANGTTGVDAKGSDDKVPPITEPEKPFGTGVDDLRALGMECGKFFLSHNAEADAVDLLEELEMVERLGELVDGETYKRVCQYMVS